MIYWISRLFVVLNNVTMLNMSFRDALWQAFNLISLKTCCKQFKFTISNSLPDAICLKIRQSYTNWLNHDRKSLQLLDNVYRFLAATKQLYEWYFLSVCPSVRPSVRLSVCPSVTPFWICSHHRIIMKFSGVITLDHAKGQGQRSKVKVTEVTTQIFVSGL